MKTSIDPRKLPSLDRPFQASAFEFGKKGILGVLGICRNSGFRKDIESIGRYRVSKRFS